MLLAWGVWKFPPPNGTVCYTATVSKNRISRNLYAVYSTGPLDGPLDGTRCGVKSHECCFATSKMY